MLFIHFVKDIFNSQHMVFLILKCKLIKNKSNIISLYVLFLKLKKALVVKIKKVKRT